MPTERIRSAVGYLIVLGTLFACDESATSTPPVTRPDTQVRDAEPALSLDAISEARPSDFGRDARLDVLDGARADAVARDAAPDAQAVDAGGCDALLPDSDGDGVADCAEQCPGDPTKVQGGLCGCHRSEADSDGDSRVNCLDGCPDDPTKFAPGLCGCGVGDAQAGGDAARCRDLCPADPDKAVPGQCGCGVPDLDTDADGTADCIDDCPDDPTVDGAGPCGCAAGEALDSDADGTPDCEDACPADPSKTDTGQCGCGAPDTDRDADGRADCVDGCPDDRAKQGEGECGCLVSDADTDRDGTPDCRDACPRDPAATDLNLCGACGTVPAERCDGLDNDCDGEIDEVDAIDAPAWYADLDGDGFGDPARASASCAGPAGRVEQAGDCNDADPEINGGATEVCDGLDNNCDGTIDEAIDSDGDSAPDCLDGCPMDHLKRQPGPCGCDFEEVFGDDGSTLTCVASHMVIPDVPATALAASPDEDAMLVGGDFSRTDRAVGSAVVVDRAEANEVTHQVGWPYVEGEVEAAVPDGQGGWYVGGNLTRVGGEGSRRLAHLRGDRSLDPDWFAGRHVDSVHSLLLDAARRRLIVAGTFSSIGGHWTGSAARLGRVDGAPVWREPRGRVAGGTVEAIASDGLGGHFIGGGFSSVDGVRCGGFARLRADGTLDRRWCRDSDSVKAIAIAEGRVYLGGSFYRDGRSKAAAYDIATGDLTDWNPNPDFDVRALIAANGRIYAGGAFRNIGGQPRSRLAALDPDTGAAQAWSPGADHDVEAMALEGGLMYIGGWFSSVGGAARGHLAAVDADTGAVTPWNPDADGIVSDLSILEDTVFVAGDFDLVGGEFRSYAAALDLRTGAATEWAPEPTRRFRSGVWTIRATPEAVYLGGAFEGIAGVPQPNLAAVDPLSGRLLPWRENGADDEVMTILVEDDTVFVGGDFDSVGAQRRGGVAALDMTTGEVLPWVPELDAMGELAIGNPTVSALAVSGNTLYLGGNFEHDGQDLRMDRWNLAAVDIATGALLPWAPRVYQDRSQRSAWVSSIATSGNTVYVSGRFTSIGSPNERGEVININADVQRPGLAAVDAAGRVTAWAPTVGWMEDYAPVLQLAVSGQRLFAYGTFTQLDGQARTRAGAWDLATGNLAPWNPAPDDRVTGLAVSGNSVYLAGDFESIGGQPRRGLAAVDAQSGLATPWAPALGGRGSAIAVTPDSVFVGGYGLGATATRGRLALVSAATGRALAPATPWPEPNGAVEAVVADDAGGWYIAGNFTHVDGVRRPHIAHLLPDRTLDPAWKVEVDDTATLSRLVFDAAGQRLFVGGRFDKLGGIGVGNGVALDRMTAEPAQGAEDARIEGVVEAVLAVPEGGWYIGGAFQSIAGVPRRGLARVHADGTLDAEWNPDIDGEVTSLAIIGDTLFLGGDFTQVGGAPRERLAAVDRATGRPTPWNPGADGTVLVLSAADDTVYAGGAFAQIGGAARGHLAALDATTGLATAWAPDADAPVQALALSAGLVYVGGEFDRLGGQWRSHLGAIDRATGETTVWDPNPNDTVRALATVGDIVYVGGGFGRIGGFARSRLAAISVATGRATPWNPSVATTVEALAVADGAVYVGGLGGPGSRLVAFDAASGQPSPWNPEVDGGAVRAIAVAFDSVYAGGDFKCVGASPRRNLAALDAVSGAPTDWIADTNAEVTTLALRDGRLYAGGAFTQVTGQARLRLAAMDAHSGEVLPWAPAANGIVRAVAVTERGVYVGGDFVRIGNVNRNHLALLDTVTGALLPWDPNVTGSRPNFGATGDVYYVAPSLEVVYIGGRYDGIGGEFFYDPPAAIDAVTAELTAWDPDFSFYGGIGDLTIDALVLANRRVWTAGTRNPRIGDRNHFFMACTDVPCAP